MTMRLVAIDHCRCRSLVGCQAHSIAMSERPVITTYNQCTASRCGYNVTPANNAAMTQKISFSGIILRRP
jgi:hypothetical protein